MRYACNCQVDCDLWLIDEVSFMLASTSVIMIIVIVISISTHTYIYVYTYVYFIIVKHCLSFI